MQQLSIDNYAGLYQPDSSAPPLTTDPWRPPSVTAFDGTLLPSISLGLSTVDTALLSQTILQALQVGYRALNCSSELNNELETGLALEKAMDKLYISRDQLFITVKLSPQTTTYDETLRRFDRCLYQMNLSHIDLCLLNWPGSERSSYLDAWRALLRLKSEKKIRALGLANFPPGPIDRLIVETGGRPLINQIELHPHFQQAGLCASMERRGIKVGVWSPLGHGLALDNPLFQKLASNYAKSPAQIVLRWHLDRGRLISPSTSKVERIAENLDILDFSISQGDHYKISLLESGIRLGPRPIVF